MPKQTIGAAVNGSKEVSDIFGYLITATFLALQDPPGHHDFQRFTNTLPPRFPGSNKDERGIRIAMVRKFAW